jgi:surface antigen
MEETMSAKHTLRAVTFIFLTLLTCQTSQASDLTTPLSATGGVRNDYDSPNSAFVLFSNLIKSWDGALSGADKKRHTNAVILTLESVPDGEVMEWYNNTETTWGKIKPILSWHVQGGVCRKLVTLIHKQGREREYEEVGCRTIDSQFWTFARR